MTWSVATPTCVAPPLIMPSTESSTPRTAPTSRPSRVARRRHGVVVAEQLVGAVDEVNVHAQTPGSQYPATSRCRPTSSELRHRPADRADAREARRRAARRRRFLYEPKWDGFRAIVFRGGDDVFIQSRDLRPLDRYFPELHDALLARLPAGCVLDGEIVIATPHGLDFDALQLRLHPAASRVAKLAKETPASFVAFDLLAVDGTRPARRAAGASAARGSSSCSRGVEPPIHLTPMTRDRARRGRVARRASKAPASTA